MTREQLTALAKRIMAMASTDVLEVKVSHVARVITILANGQVLGSDDGDDVSIRVAMISGDYSRQAAINLNQIDDTTLRAMIQWCEAEVRSRIGYRERLIPAQQRVQDTYLPVHLWHDATVGAMATARSDVVPELLATVSRAGLTAAGFLGLMARADAVMTNDGIFAFHEETDSEITVTARTPDGKGSGWGGQAVRNWDQMRPPDVAARAVDVAKRAANPVALEPGRRTAILSPAAVAQVLRFLADQFDALGTDTGTTAFSKAPRGNKLGQRVVDARINMRSDPADPEGGFCPWFDLGLANSNMSWVEHGVLKNLAYYLGYAMARGKPYSEIPLSIRVSGGSASVDQMIANCADGVYVNRFSGVDLIDRSTCLTTGVTRDGCFYVKDGKISKAIKNFRFLESPFFFLNKIEMLGVPERAAFGFTPKSLYESGIDAWPRRPIIVPPMMVRDFNFNAIADAV